MNSNSRYWIVFAVVQIAGALLPLAKAYSQIPVYAGVALLLPGDLIASVAGKISPFIFYPLVFLINAAVWFMFRKMLMPDTVPSSEAAE